MHHTISYFNIESFVYVITKVKSVIGFFHLIRMMINREIKRKLSNKDA